MSFLAKFPSLPNIENKLPSSKNIKDNPQVLKNAAQNMLSPGIPKIPSSKKIQRQHQMIFTPITNKSEKKILNSQNSKILSFKKIEDSLSKQLIQSMQSRLKTIQSTCQSQRKQIKTQNQTLNKLRQQNNFLKQNRKGSGQICNKMNALRKQNQQLENKVNEMIKYLQNYGLKITQGKIQGQLNGKKLKKDIKKPKFDYKLPTQIDIGTIKNRVNDLNAGLQGQGKGTQIYMQNGIHKFRKAQPLSLNFYKNGIQIKQYPFYPYKQEKSLKILNDLLDGYFPYILKAKYPNGVFLQVVDHTNEKFDQSTKQDYKGEIIGGSQNKIQSQDQKQKDKQKNVKIIDENKEKDKNQKKINVRKPLKKIMSQKVLPKIQEQQDNQQCQQKEGIIYFKTAEHTMKEKNQYPLDQLCTLKIRSHEGKIYILQLGKNSKIKQIYNWMGRVIKQNFRLMSNYPKIVFQLNQDKNLQCLGLWPNALLHIHIIHEDPQ